MSSYALTLGQSSWKGWEGALGPPLAGANAGQGQLSPPWKLHQAARGWRHQGRGPGTGAGPGPPAQAQSRPSRPLLLWRREAWGGDADVSACARPPGVRAEGLRGCGAAGLRGAGPGRRARAIAAGRAPAGSLGPTARAGPVL